MINKSCIILIFFIIYKTVIGDALSASNKQIIYINSNKLEADRKNSVYDIDYKNDIIYIPDYRNNKIIIIGKDHSVVKTVSTQAPHSIEVDDKGNIYITSLSDNRVRKFDKDIIEIADWDSKIHSLLIDHRPYSIDSDDDANIYIAAHDLIIKVSENGQFIKKFDFSKLDSVEVYPHGITFHKNKIYVAERETHKLLIFDTEGKYLNSFTTKIKSDNKRDLYFDPHSINFYNDTFILVPNYKNSSLHVFDIKGEEIKIVGGKGKSYGQWLSLMNVVEDKKGNIYTVEEDSNRIQIINFLELINSN